MGNNDLSLNLADVAGLVRKRKKFISLFVLAAALTAAALVLFVLPKYYKSTAVIIATNPALADKSRLFNENIEGLYSAFGGEDDLNRIFGIAGLDTTYKLLVEKFDLVNYFRIEGSDASLNKQQAVVKLKDEIELVKNDLYQLKISATTKDRKLSADIVNQMAENIQAIAQATSKQSNDAIINKLSGASAELQKQYAALSDSSNNEISAIKKDGLLVQLRQNEKLINQYKLAFAENTPVLIVLEKAYPAAKADRPKKLLVILGSMIAALVFSILLVVILERRK